MLGRELTAALTPDWRDRDPLHPAALAARSELGRARGRRARSGWASARVRILPGSGARDPADPAAGAHARAHRRRDPPRRGLAAALRRRLLPPRRGADARRTARRGCASSRTSTRPTAPRGARTRSGCASWPRATAIEVELICSHDPHLLELHGRARPGPGLAAYALTRPARSFGAARAASATWRTWPYVQFVRILSCGMAARGRDGRRRLRPCGASCATEASSPGCSRRARSPASWRCAAGASSAAR